ncbi:hypothetical protein K438DRAFT_1993918 [Mycena galopus ATCC 62051]|nr:hypothetical protein K438DRAFT_1993918 [Mycena galopus ATCC 62051]
MLHPARQKWIQTVPSFSLLSLTLLTRPHCALPAQLGRYVLSLHAPTAPMLGAPRMPPHSALTCLAFRARPLHVLHRIAAHRLHSAPAGSSIPHPILSTLDDYMIMMDQQGC